MDEIGQNIANQIINESAKNIALFPGSFKPAHKGHFEVVKRASQHVDEVHVIISNNIREGYTPEVSLKVWNQYKKLLPENVKVYIAKANSPITEIYDIVKDKTNNYLVIFGKGEQDRYNSINENRDKYSNVDVVDAGEFEGLSATALREAIGSKNRLKIKSLIPEGITVNEFLMNFQIHEVKVNKPGLVDFKDLKPGELYKYTDDKAYKDEIIKFEKYNPNGFGVATPINSKWINPNTDEIQKIIIYPEDNYIRYGKSNINEEKIPGGLASGMTLQDLVDKHNVTIEQLQNQLEKGIKAELEHTTSKDIAEEIAMDHLFKDPKYYDKLATIDTNEIKINNPTPTYDNFLDAAKGKNPSDLKAFWEDTGIYDGVNKYGDVGLWLNSMSPSERIKLYNKFRQLPSSLNESIESNKIKFIQLLNKCAEECCEELGIKKPEIKIINNPNYTNENQSYAGYIPASNEVKLVIYGRTLADSCRSLSHELKHAADNSQGLLTPDAGKDGDDHENRANSYAGVKLREFGRENPEIYFLKYE